MSNPTLLSDAAAPGDPDSPIRVVVTPSQSAYFAGETLSVRITFTNTNARTTTGGGAMPRFASKSHKRASYSVSSAPIAKPPTSPAGLYKPRTPTTAAPASPTTNAPDGTPMRRRGLIGRGKGKQKSLSVDLVEQRREKMLTKSLSLTIDGEGLKEEVRSAPHAQRSFTADAYLPPTSPRVSSPLARSETLPLPSKHPHARKQSVMDGTQFPYLNGNEASTSPTSSSTLSTVATLTSPTSGPPTPSASASTSSFSLVLDPIAEVPPIASPYSYLSPTASASAGGLGIGSALHSPSIAIEAPSPPSASLEAEKLPYAPPSSSQTSSKFSNRQIKTNRPPNIGLGKPPFLDLSREKNNTELILYSYAQMKGTVTLTPLPPNNLTTASSAKSLKSPRTPAPSSLSSMSPSASISSPHLSPTPTPALLPEAQLSLQKVQALSALRYALLKGSATAVGGGSMDITSRTHSRTPSASRVGGGGLGGGLGSGSWGSLSIPNSAGTVSAYGPSLGTIHSGSTEGPVSPSISRRPSRAHSRASSFSSGLLSIFGSPFGLGGSGPVSAPVNLPSSVSTPNVSSPNIGGEVPRRPGGLGTRNRTVSASAGLLPSSSSGWPGSDSGPSSAPFDQSFTRPASAGLEPPSSSSVSSFSPSRSGLGLGLGLGWPLVGGSGSVEDIDPDVPLPTFEVPSAVLAVDAELEPGESRSYEYSILLPSNLPPTFRGRTFRFEYELVVGICRSAADGSNRPVGNIGSGGVGPMGSMSKVMKVPIRVYTNVVVGKLPTPYDLLWPVTKRRSLHALGHRRGGRMASNSNAKEKDDSYTGKVVELTPGAMENSRDSKRDFRIHDSSSPSGAAQASSGSGTIAELKEYAKRLVAEFPQLPEVLGSGAEVSESPSSTSTSESFSSSISVAASTPASSISKPSLSPLVEEDSGSGEESKSMENVNGYGNGNAVTPAPASTRTSPSSAAELAFREKERVAKLNLQQREREESDEPIAIGGCGEAVEILTRIPKKVSYDVNKDGVKVAVLTFIKSAFRLGETIHGVVELNERIGRARVVQLSAHLETHESLPYAISTTPNTPSAIRQLKRVHVEHHSSFALSTLRTTFALDIPSDASPAFQIKVGEDSSFASEFGSNIKPKLEGGLEWKVRLCLLVAVAKETSDVGTEGVRFKSLIRDGPKGEWGSAWKAPVNLAPSEKPMVSSSSPQPSNNKSSQPQQQGIVKSWTSFIAASLLGAAEGGYHDGSEFADEDDEFDEDGERPNPTSSYDGIKPNRAGGVGVGVNYGGGRESSWQEVKLETVECEVPLRVWPGNTAFKPVDVVFEV